MYKKLLIALILACSATMHADVISSGTFKADLNPAFPGLLSYTFAGNTVALPTNLPSMISINDKDATSEVNFVKTSARSAAYNLALKDIGVTMTVSAVISRNALAFTITDIIETGETLVKTIEIPGLVLMAGDADADMALGNFPAPSYASKNPKDYDIFTKVADFKDEDKSRNKDAAGIRGASYAFISDGKLSSGMYSNVLDENFRMKVRTQGQGDDASVTVTPGKWIWREIPTQTVWDPQVKLIVATDNNGDGQVTWQDGAIAYRANTPHPYSSEETKNYPIAHIAMNFGSQATNPFLRVLDNAKKIWLYTDGLGQRIQFKGYQSEGHDSSHPDYAGNVGRRQGGREDLNFVMRRGHDFDVLSGVHINAQEYHKESKYFNTDIADLNRIGWSWLDESYLTNYRYDAAYGTLNQRLADMREDLPWLDFVYLDVYYGRGWPAWNMHTRTNELGIIQFTEFPGVMERAVVWNHVANDWTQAIGGKGDRSEIARFIYYSQKDTFKHEPLLRGTNCDGFMGWHAERNMLQTVKSAFVVNLPTKYLQHFSLLRMENEQALFNYKVKAFTKDGISKLYGRDGQLINLCRYEEINTRPSGNLLFIPWNPDTEEKIYHWNDRGGDSKWVLPNSWAGTTSALLYRLTDLGRVYERDIPVVDGKVTMTDIIASSPYVLYKNMPAPLDDIQWGQGGLVADPGFDSHSFRYWKKTGKTVADTDNDLYGQTELLFKTADAGEVTQVVSGLVPGQIYAASVWTSIEGQRDATLSVAPYIPTIKPIINKDEWKTIKTNTKHHGGNEAKQMFDGSLETIWHTDYGDNEPKHPHSVTIDFKQVLLLDGFVQTARSDFRNGVIKGFEAWTSMNNKSWTKVASGNFTYDDKKQATVTFKKPIKAKFFRLVAKSEKSGGPWASCAELDMIGKPVPAADVKSKFTEMTRTINETVLTNFTDQSSKYMRKWHRMKILFAAPENGSAVIALRSGKGKPGEVIHFDDVRLVASGISTARKGKNVILFEDFENVDEGWGPFMYGWQGPMNTHLSEANPPYTDDTIGGEFSLKSRKENAPDMLYRTVPATLAFMPNTKYRVTFEYLCDSPGFFKFVAGTDQEGVAPTVETLLEDGSWKVKKTTTTFKTDDRSDWFIGISKVERSKRGTIVIDNILVEEMK